MDNDAYQKLSKAGFEDPIGIIIAARDRLLQETDWTQGKDAPVDQAVWAAYRQALRDVPQQSGFPENVAWPTKPE